MSRLRQHYEEELSDLKEQGRLFSERFPKLAPFLGQSSQDPDIERLLEGFAFISAKLRSKIEDAYPELSQQFLELVAPLYFKPQPSCTVLEFHPNPSMATFTKKILRGTPIVMKKEQHPYGFTTLYDLDVQPLEVVGVEKKMHQHQMILQFSFKCLYGAEIQDLKDLQFYLQGDLRQSMLLSYLLLNELNSAN